MPKKKRQDNSEAGKESLTVKIMVRLPPPAWALIGAATPVFAYLLFR